MQRVVQKRVQDLPQLVADPRCVDRDHEADAVVAGSEIHRVVEPIDDAHALPHDVGQAGHVDVVQFALDVAGLPPVRCSRDRRGRRDDRGSRRVR